MAYPTHILDHLARGLGLTAAQLKRQPLWQSLASALLASVQDLEDQIFAMLAGRELNTAVGVQLDALGNILGVKRDGRIDETYRLRLRVQVLINLSSGTIPDLLAIVTKLGFTATLTEYIPAAFVIVVNGAVTAAQGDDLAMAIRTAKAGCVNAVVEYSLFSGNTTFTFDGTTAQAIDNGHLAVSSG